MSQEVKLAVERALAKLIGRFGTTGEVISELRYALKKLDEPEVPASTSGTDATTVIVEEPGPVSGSSAPPEAEPPPDETPKKRRGMGRKK